ncbi:MAG TPA: OB-fold domain-containing protein [Sporichthyaceae bacterium]|nr:OB-fold domain-containing protein [Sporichthyaceae bacterium]
MSRPLAPELFASLDPLALAGSRCTACATVQFPAARQCAHCAAEDPAPITLPAQGRIWTWTIQRFEPKAPYLAPADGFLPYAVGYVDLGEVLVESLLQCSDGEPAIGAEVHLVRATAPGGHFTYAFAR